MDNIPIIHMECEKLGIQIDFSKHDVKKYVMIDLLLEDGRKAHQFLFKEVPEFDPNLIRYHEVNYPSYGDGRYGHYCKYMFSFNFVYGFIKMGKFMGMDSKFFVHAKTASEKYYFGKDISYDQYINTILHFRGQSVLDENKSVFDTQYSQWLNGDIKFIRHFDCPNCITCLKKDTKVIKQPSSNSDTVKYSNEYFTAYNSKTIYEYFFNYISEDNQKKY